MPTPKMHDYQIYAMNHIITHPFCGLFLPMGLGKSLITLAALAHINPTGHVLVIAPKNIARSTWIDEIHKWNIPMRYLSLIVNDKGKELTKKKREELYLDLPNRAPSLCFINREKIPDLVGFMLAHDCWPFSTVIIDESQSFKSFKSSRFKALKRVRPILSRVILLTGTPTPKDLQDLWSQIFLLDMGQRLGKTITAYRDTFFYPGIIVSGYPVSYIPKEGAEEEIYRRIGDIVISMKSPLTLPPITYNNIYVHMDDEEKQRYKKFKKEYIFDLESGESVEAPNAGVLSAKLMQIAAGTIYTDDQHHFEIIHTKKLEMLQYIIENANDNVIVAYWFQSDLHMISNMLNENNIPFQIMDGKPETIRAWNRKEIPVLLLQPASSGHGINIQEGGHTLIWYTVPWSLEHYQQTVARIYRQGQTQPCIVHHILNQGTIDNAVMQSQKTKDFSQQALLDAVRAEMPKD